MERPHYTSTYRLQLTKSFPFDRAIAILPYLKSLGIEMVYTSPYFTIEPGSLNPYKILSASTIHEELGGEEGFERFCKACLANGIAHMIDFVPNHMGMTPLNPWIYDILKKGKESIHAEYFDIDWDFGKGKLILPVLADKSRIEIDGEELVVDQKLRYPFSGSPEGKMEEILARQPYRLVHWREGAAKVNYRRFFDITELIGIREESDKLYKDYHESLFKWIQKGWIQGIRIDHPDGLCFPSEYLQKLRKDVGEKIYLIVEKILQPEEEIRSDWSVDGSVGYEMLNNLNGIFVDETAKKQFDEIYQSFAKFKKDPEQALFTMKERYIKTYLAAELTMFTKKLWVIHSASGGDLSERQIRKGLLQFVGRFPIYRSYIGKEDTLIDPLDRKAFFGAISKMTVSSKIQNFFAVKILQIPYRKVLLELQSRMPAFFAKGFEDTFLYRYLRLTSLNEVGGEPTTFGLTPEVFHRRNQMRYGKFPLQMATTSTHDTKRSLDTRMRINALSEMPEKWRELCLFWKSLKLGFPDRSVEYLFYQSLIGIWPDEPPSNEEKQGLAERLKAYLIKALREGKDRSDWIHPNLSFENKALKAVDVLMCRDQSDPFWQSLYPLQKEIVRAGRIKTLSAILLKLALPGVCDFYQGEELWDNTLVDPDNRKEVDFARREEMLKSKGSIDLVKEWEDLETGRLKLHLITEGLNLRKKEKELFLYGDYQPLLTQKREIIAFQRRLDDKCLHIELPRFGLSAKSRSAPEGFVDHFNEKRATQRKSIQEKLIQDWPFVFATNFSS